MDEKLTGLTPEQVKRLRSLLDTESMTLVPGQGLWESAGDIYNIATQKPAGAMQRGTVNAVKQIPQWLGGAGGDKPIPLSKSVLGRMAGSKGFTQLLRGGTALGAVGGVLGAGDVLLGNDSMGNKAMDATAMTIGGVLGAAGGPLGIAAGAGAGKMVSDATQWLFGDKKTAEQRALEQALINLQGGRF